VHRLAFRRFFTDQSGRVVLWQRPNLPLIVWFSSTVLAHLWADGAVRDVLRVVSVVALIGWALLELLRGTSPFRRVLGLAVLLYSGYRLLG
jgi:hypothetical protein